jgi:small nuclear ribonucleoprotein (snRNP)-like protein
MFIEEDLEKELEQLVGETIIVELNNGSSFSGRLIDFSQYWIKIESDTETDILEALPITAIRYY